MRLALSVALLVLALSTLAVAEDLEPYSDFRYMSGLPGGGYGVTSGGHVGFDGALQMNIPIGYTPGAGQFSITGSTSATNGGIPTSINDEGANSTLTLGFGMTIQDYRLWVADMVIGEGWQDAINLQLQVVLEHESWPAISVGVTDLMNDFYSLYIHRDHHDSRSFFVAATKQFGDALHPWWGTLGFGNRRFNSNPFLGVSYQLLPQVKLTAEYDGWNLNAGAAYDIAGGWGDGQWHAVFLAGVTDMDHVTLSLGITFSE